MTTTTREPASTVHPGHRDDVSEQLQATLVDLIALALTTKQLHWNLTGPRFIGLHRQLDDIVDIARSYADTVAEVAATLGAPPSGQAHVVAAASTLSPVRGGWVSDDDALNLVAERLSAVAGGARARAAALGELDPVSESVLVDLIGELEKQVWMLDASR
jgi:starvation-inducible DNA-binding protein